MTNKDNKFMQEKTHKVLSVNTILSRAKEINTDIIAKEILQWIADNVEHFVDNQKREFKLDLIIDSDKMPESTKLQELYLSIPEDSKAVSIKELKNIKDIRAGAFDDINKCRSYLNKITKKCHADMKNNKELLEKIYKRMSFFYEMVGISKGKLLLKELSGAVSIINFEYEAFSVGIKVSPMDMLIKNDKGQMERKTIQEDAKNYLVPEGFAVWLEISFKENTQSTNLF